MIPAVLALLAGLLAIPAQAGSSLELCGAEAKPCLRYGVEVFEERCSLCHGSDGMGEGVLALSMKDYPAPNLLEPRVTYDDESLRRAIVEGPAFAGMSSMMPPWGDELTDTQVDSVTLFVAYLRKDTEAAIKLAREAASAIKPSIKIGRSVFLGRCALCHGAEALGDGRMAPRLNPKPVNLTLSRAPGSYIKTIVTKGGGAVGRSSRMPPWAGNLTDPEIASVILYLNTFRPPQEDNPAPLSPKASAKEGAKVFREHCSVCHGEDGQGEGPAAQSLSSKPTNLTLSHLPDGYMRTLIAEGSQPLGRSANMPAWKDSLTPVQIDSVIKHINTLRPSIK